MKKIRKIFMVMMLFCSLIIPEVALANTVRSIDEVVEVEIIKPAENTIVPPTEYISVLMYHHFAIRDMGEGNGVVTTQSQLEDQIIYLKEQGYEFISLEKLSSLLREVEKDKTRATKKTSDKNSLGLDKKYICITMDDGYLSNYELAFPIFQKYKIPISIFAVTDSITQQTGLQKFNWEQAQKMVDSRYVKIYNHTANHAPVSAGTEDNFLDEVAEAEIALAQNLDQKACKALAFPNGRFTAYTQKELAEMGFELLFTVDYGVITKQTSRYAIPRINVDSGFSGKDLVTRIEGAARRSFLK